MAKILYVEDEAFLAKIVKETLEKEGYEVVHVAKGGLALTKFHAEEPDICVLDIMLPDRNGFEIAEDIRKTNQEIPILFLTAKDQTTDVVRGFKTGGNDYLKKPFSMEELIVRIENLLVLNGKSNKAIKAEKAEILIGKEFAFHPHKYLLAHSTNQRTLSLKESQILELLCQNKNSTTDRKEILLKVWNDDSYFNSRTLDVYMRKLRKYFEVDPTVEIITLKGLGYQFVC